ncbi:hypothetical protein IFU40_12495 [Microbacterium sp. CFBP 13617]|uniref:hypothetical protein n=1 Tax=Microbacterium sp. CFBP 13617 TaxID=2774035 RepID=UPI001786F59A|nr:hypothetical protein [Microbacterium sp. CFBP 13617]MBD8219452.1 hypothetical protein [Microbacterium sp. CFBP 13617]
MYIARDEWAAARPADRHRFAILAAVRRARDAGGVVSHLSAAVLHGLPLYRFRGGPVHAMVPRSAHPPSGRALRRHTGALDPQDVVVVDGIRCTSLGRERVVSARGRRGVREAAWVIEFADGRAELPGESVSRLQLHRLGFRDIDLQVAVEGPRGSAYFVDIALRDVRTFWEFDGEVKYRDPSLRRGRSVEDVVLDEKRREDWIRGVTQWRLCRGGFADIASPEALAARLAAFGVRPPR